MSNSSVVEYTKYPDGMTLRKIMLQFNLSLPEINSLNGTPYTVGDMDTYLYSLRSDEETPLLLPSSKVKAVYEYDDISSGIVFAGYEPVQQSEPERPDEMIEELELETVEPELEIVDLKAIPTLFMLESEEQVLKAYWDTQQIGNRPDDPNLVTQQSIQKSVDPLLEPFDRSKAEQLFIDKELIPVLLTLYQEFPNENMEDMYGEVDWDVYPQLTREFYDSFLAERNEDGLSIWTDELQEEFDRTDIHPLDDDMRVFIDQLIQERGWTGMVSTISDMTRLAQDWVGDDLGANFVDIHTDPSLMSPYTLIQEWGQGFEYGYAFENGEHLPFLPNVPSLISSIADDNVDGSEEDLNNPEFWWRKARALRAEQVGSLYDAILFQDFNSAEEFIQTLGMNVGVDVSNLDRTGRLATLGEALLINDIGNVENLTSEEVAQYLSTITERYPDLAVTLDSGSFAWENIADAEKYVGVLETERQLDILEIDSELEGLINDIQNLPNDFLGVSTSEVKSAFEAILQSNMSDIDNVEVAEDVLEVDIIGVEGQHELEGLRREAAEGLFGVAGLALMGAPQSTQVILGILELIATKNPTALAFEGLGVLGEFSDVGRSFYRGPTADNYSAYGAEVIQGAGEIGQGFAYGANWAGSGIRYGADWAVNTARDLDEAEIQALVEFLTGGQQQPARVGVPNSLGGVIPSNQLNELGPEISYAITKGADGQPQFEFNFGEYYRTIPVDEALNRGLIPLSGQNYLITSLGDSDFSILPDGGNWQAFHSILLNQTSQNREILQPLVAELRRLGNATDEDIARLIRNYTHTLDHDDLYAFPYMTSSGLSNDSGHVFGTNGIYQGIPYDSDWRFSDDLFNHNADFYSQARDFFDEHGNLRPPDEVNLFKLDKNGNTVLDDNGNRIPWTLEDEREAMTNAAVDEAFYRINNMSGVERSDLNVTQISWEGNAIQVRPVDDRFVVEFEGQTGVVIANDTGAGATIEWDDIGSDPVIITEWRNNSGYMVDLDAAHLFGDSLPVDHVGFKLGDTGKSGHIILPNGVLLAVRGNFRQ